MNQENNFNALNGNNNDALNNNNNTVNNQPVNQNNFSNVQPQMQTMQQPDPMQNVQQPMNNMQMNNQVMPNNMNNQVMPNNMNSQYQMNNQVIQPQPYYNNVTNQPKKSNKTLFIVLGVVAVVLILAIVGGVLLLKGKGAIGGKADFSKPDSVAKAYVNALIKKDYKEAKKYVYIPEDGFINDDDFLDFITRKDYSKKLIDRKIEKVTEVRVASDVAEYTIVTKGEDNLDYNVTVPLIINDGKWYINESNLFVKNWKFAIPGGTKVTIDGEEVDKKYISGKEGNYDLYTLSAIAKESKHFALKNNLGELELDMTPTGDSKTINIDMELKNEELLTKGREFVKTAWNDMIKAASAKKDLAEIRKYFDDSIDTDTINIYYKNIANLMKNNANVRMTQVVPRQNALNYISTNDVITLNFGYTVNWTWTVVKSNRTMDRNSSIRLKVDGDSFKIYQVTDERMFSWLNQFTNDF